MSPRRNKEKKTEWNERPDIFIPSLSVKVPTFVTHCEMAIKAYALPLDTPALLEIFERSNVHVAEQWAPEVCPLEKQVPHYK